MHRLPLRPMPTSQHNVSFKAPAISSQAPAQSLPISLGSVNLTLPNATSSSKSLGWDDNAVPDTPSARPSKYFSKSSLAEFRREDRRARLRLLARLGATTVISPSSLSFRYCPLSWLSIRYWPQRCCSILRCSAAARLRLPVNKKQRWPKIYGYRMWTKNFLRAGDWVSKRHNYLQKWVQFCSLVTKLLGITDALDTTNISEAGNLLKLYLYQLIAHSLGLPEPLYLDKQVISM
jgi:hypothetical protein